jgi:hypothetical protein
MGVEFLVTYKPSVLNKKEIDRSMAHQIYHALQLRQLARDMRDDL